MNQFFSRTIRPSSSVQSLSSLIARHARPLFDYDSILSCIGDQTRVVLIGEASHGTQEFYEMRSEITKRLIEQKGYTIVAIEADWPDAYRVNSYVRSHLRSIGEDETAEQSLRSFQRFPTWMWRNHTMVSFVEWLRRHNAKIASPGRETGIYGLDLYSLNASRQEVLNYLESVGDEQLLESARRNYACFNRFDNDDGVYGYKTGFGLSASCQQQVLQVLRHMLERHAQAMSRGESVWEQDAYFYAKHNAILVADAEEYYRNMYVRSANTWNIRDSHMYRTLDALMTDISDQSGESKSQRKAVVWAHNSHIGDASHTESSDRGEFNIGQLAREKLGAENTFHIGFTTFNGSVTAANNWDEDPHHMKVRDGLDGSYEQLFHESLQLLRKEKNDPHLNGFLMNFKGNHMSDDNSNLVIPSVLNDQLQERRLERMIGVLYKPKTERASHYIYCNLPKQFDCVIHVDRTRALKPLEAHPRWIEAEKKDLIPETYPSGL